MQKKITAVSLAAAGVVLPALWLAACAVNPVTGERELALVSESQEIALGRDAARQAEATIGLTGDAQLQDYVANLGQALAASSERPDLPWEFQVVDDPVPNAFALPGGFIFVTRGLLSLLDSEAELAAVLGHEIGHVTARHSVSQISRAQLAQLGLGIGSVAAPEAFEEFGQLAGTGLGLLFLKHGRDDERQADQLGFNYIVDEGYDSRQMAEVFAALDASGQLVAASSTPSWLSSHPSGPDRIEAALSRTRSLPANLRGGRVNTEGYLEQIDGLIYGPDPRQGFFDGDTFYHPDLAFSLYVPDDWQRANSAAAVSALSPAGDAAMQLSIGVRAGAARAGSATTSPRPRPRSSATSSSWSTRPRRTRCASRWSRARPSSTST
jgi:predicted Zn-dependent protease